ncbi:MAG: phage tail tape measure protein [Mesorhizobium sp.]|uniref:phage tail tape measure protein n=1 Tax=Mesorhizobium sp. TaxID=1871066 RepID=UPI000FE8EA92|nr:phage tail tape measure protein [Mesorhizobium sp.]RWL87728.1 MAG: phage tail tape measure protein [Mesorhizobium sp.]
MAPTIKQRIELDGGAELKRELAEFGAAGRKAFRDLQAAAAETKGLPSGFFGSLKQAQVQLQGLAKQFKDFGKATQDIGKTFSTHLTLPILGAGAGILKQAADFEKAGNSFAANAGVVGKAFEDATAKAQELGQASVFSSTEALQGMTELSKIGLDFQTIMGGAAKAMVDLAAANDTQLAPAAAVIGDLMNQFGLKAAQLPQIVNEVTGATIQSKLSFEDYALAIGQAGGAAGSLGVSFEDFNAVLAATASSFASGSDAGTSFKTFLQRLVPQSKQAAAMMDKLGLKFFDASGRMKSMSQIAQELQDKLGKLSQEDLNDAVSTIFGTDAMRTAIALMKQGGKGIDDMMAKLLATVAADIAATRVKGLTGELNQFNSAVENLSIAIGKSGLLDFVTRLVERATEFTQSLSNLDPAVLRLGTEIGAVVAAIGPALIALGLLGRGIGFVFGGIGQLIGAVILLRNAFLTLTPLGRLILLVAAGIKGVGVVLDLIKNKQFDSAKAANAHQKALGELDAAMQNVKAGVPGAAEALKQLAQRHLDAAKAALADAEAQAKGAREAFEAAKLSQEQSALGPLEKRLGLDVDPALEQLIIREKNVAQAQRELQELQNKIDGKVVSNIEDLRTQAAGTADSLKNVAAAAADTGSKVEGLSHQIQVFRGGGADGKMTSETFDVVNGVAKRAEDSKKALDDVGASAEKAGQKVKAVSDDIANSVRTVPAALNSNSTSAAVDSVVNDVNRIKPAADEAATGLKAALNPTDDVGAGLNAAIDTAVDGVITGVQKMPGAAQEAVGGLNSALTDIDTAGAQQAAQAIAGPFQALPGVFSAIFQGLGALVQGGFGNLSSTIASLASQIRTEINSIISALREAVAQAQSLRAQAGGSSSGGGGGSQGGFAGGGYLAYGPGTPTSDSIPIMASVKEFIMQAKATAYYGPGFMHALNQMKIPREFFRGIRGFRVGGLIDHMNRSLSIPHLAGGGMVPELARSTGGLSGKLVHVDLQYGPTMQQVLRAIAEDSAVDKLARWSVGQSLTKA